MKFCPSHAIMRLHGIYKRFDKIFRNRRFSQPDFTLIQAMIDNEFNIFHDEKISKRQQLHDRDNETENKRMKKKEFSSSLSPSVEKLRPFTTLTVFIVHFLAHKIFILYLHMKLRFNIGHEA